jgi:hypothetical protein
MLRKRKFQIERELKIECPVADAKEVGVRNPAEETLCHRTIVISHIPQPNAIHFLSFAFHLLPLKKFELHPQCKRHAKRHYPLKT